MTEGVDKILKNLEDFMEIPESKIKDPLEKYNPLSYRDYNAISEQANVFYFEHKYGLAIYFYSLIMKYKNFEDAFFNTKDLTKLTVIEKDAHSTLNFCWTLIDINLKENFKKTKPDITLPPKGKEGLEIIKKYTTYYKDYKRMTELFGTDYTPAD